MSNPSASRRIALELAAFLDSPRARGLALPQKDVRRIAEAYLAVCYDELGKAPKLLDGEDVRMVLTELLPGRLTPRDSAAEHVPELLERMLDHLDATEVVLQLFEQRRALAEHAPALVEQVRSGANAARRTAVKTDPIVHKADKTGRNDPCPCGSGKKFKKCHGKEG